MRMRPVLFSIVVFCAFNVLSPPLHAGDLTSEVIYKSAERKSATFVPLAVIERGLADAPMAADERAYLAYRIETADAGGRCSEAVFLHRAFVRDEHRRSLPQIMAESEGLFVGEVQAVVTGWSTSYQNAVTVVWVSPVSILENAGGRLDGNLFAFIIARAEMQVGDKRLCNTSGPEGVPVKGTRLLINAGDRVGDGRLFYGVHYFPMTGDEVRSMPFLDVRPFDAMPLATARAAAARLKEKVQR